MVFTRLLNSDRCNKYNFTKLMKIFIFLAFLFCFVGCETLNPSTDIEKSMGTSALVIGVETSLKYGKCHGSSLDATNMSNFLGQFSHSVICLKNEDATVENVKREMENAVTNSLAIIYYSGHGGSYNFNDKETMLEEDGTDEFLCLYDNYLRDDDIWKIISKSSGRCFLIFDCCHSRTMFKLGENHKRKSLASSEKTPNMLCWSSCEDSSNSYGASNGGFFTNVILTHFKQNISYEEFWKILKSEQTLKQLENIQQTKLGVFDLSRNAFR